MRAKAAKLNFGRKNFGAGTKAGRIKSRVLWYAKERKRQYGGAVGLGAGAGAYVGYKAGRKDRR